MRVWIDQDLCTGDGLCTDHCPEVFVLLEDGISYVREGGRVASEPGGMASIVPVPRRFERAVIVAADDCPGECIFVEGDLPVIDLDDDIVEAELLPEMYTEQGAAAAQFSVITTPASPYPMRLRFTMPPIVFNTLVSLVMKPYFALTLRWISANSSGEASCAIASETTLPALGRPRPSHGCTVTFAG